METEKAHEELGGIVCVLFLTELIPNWSGERRSDRACAEEQERRSGSASRVLQ